VRVRAGVCAYVRACVQECVCARADTRLERLERAPRVARRVVVGRRRLVPVLACGPAPGEPVLEQRERRGEERTREQRRGEGTDSRGEERRGSWQGRSRRRVMGGRACEYAAGQHVVGEEADVLVERAGVCA
jgi:hypothetical protein